MHRVTAIRPARTSIVALSALGLAAFAGLLVAGPLSPPAGAVAGTYKTLAEVEPRIPITAATTPGDADSLFRINQPGSYYLTGNIIGVAGKHGIEIATDGVAVDLSGFELVGTVGSFDGITATFAGATNTRVANGSVRSWGGDGVDLGFAPCISSDLRNLTCSRNVGVGLKSGFDAAVSDCISSQNGSGGFTIATGTRIDRCTATLNGSIGIYAGGGCLIADCTIERNSGDGVFATSDCTIRRNTCIGNGSSLDGAGIHLAGLGNRVEDNQCSGNDRGIDADAGGSFFVRNTCSGNTIAFVLAANNVYGPIINRAAPASPAVSGSSAVSALGSTDANANFAY